MISLKFENILHEMMMRVTELVVFIVQTEYPVKVVQLAVFFVI